MSPSSLGTTDDVRSTDSHVLYRLADSLKEDCKLLSSVNRLEAMKLFRLYCRITAELHRRNNPALRHEIN